MFVYIWSLENKRIQSHLGNWEDVALSTVRKETYTSRSPALAENASFQGLKQK